MKKWAMILLSSSSFATYTPWYTGPLIATTAVNEPIGHTYIQPILFAGDFYGIYTPHWKLHHAKHDLYQLNYSLVVQFGLVRDFIDGEVTIQGFTNFFRGKQNTSWGDTSVGFGIQILRDAPNSWKPDIRLLLDIIIPSGKYNGLDDALEGFDGTGRGSWIFDPFLCIRKSFGATSNHPFRIGLNLSYTLGTTTTVRGSSIYGGSKLTHGSIKPGDQIFTDLFLEYSLTKKWVFVLENIYTHNFKSTFSGQSGGNRVGLPSSDVFSFAPELEYNVSENYGWIGGIFFSAAGRNLPSFVTAMLSFTRNF